MATRSIKVWNAATSSQEDVAVAQPDISSLVEPPQAPIPMPKNGGPWQWNEELLLWEKYQNIN